MDKLWDRNYFVGGATFPYTSKLIIIIIIGSINKRDERKKSIARKVIIIIKVNHDKNKIQTMYKKKIKQLVVWLDWTMKW